LKNLLIKHSSIYFLGNILRQLIGFLMLPIYTRYLSPSDYGVIGLILFSINLLEIFFCANLVQAIPKFFYENKEESQQFKIVSTSLLFSIIFSILTTLGFFYFRPEISLLLFGNDDFAIILAFFSFLIVYQTIENYSLLLIRIQQRPSLYLIISIIKLLLQISFNILFVVFLEKGIYGIALSFFISSTLISSVLLVYAFMYVGFSFDIKLAWRMVLFCFPLWISGFAAIYTGSANRLFIRIFSSLHDVGLFELAMRFGSIITALIWQPFSLIWEIERFKIYNQDNRLQVFQNVFILISSVLIISALAISIFSDTIIKIIADKAFHHATFSIPFLTYAHVFSCLIIFVNFSFLISNKTIFITYLTYSTALISTFFYILLIPFWGHIGAAISLMISLGLSFYIFYLFSIRFFDMKLNIKFLTKILLLSFISNIITYHFNFSNIILNFTFNLLIFFINLVLISFYTYKNLSFPLKNEIKSYIFKSRIYHYILK
jgi:O-antigen/teichoic acid export membrane protein